MYNIIVHNGIRLLIKSFQFVGWWDSDNGVPTKLRKVAKCLLFLFYASFAVSLAVGAINSDNEEDSSFLSVITIAAIVQLFKLSYIIWRSTEIRGFIINVGSFTVDDPDEFHRVEKKLKNFMAFVNGFIMVLALVATIALGFDAMSAAMGKRFLHFSIAFPLDWRHNVFGYWITFIYVAIQSVYSEMIFALDIIVWYLMLIFTMKYHLLGHRLRRLSERKSIERSMDATFDSSVKIFVSVIETHENLKE